MKEMMTKRQVMQALSEIAGVCAGDYLQVTDGVLTVTDTGQLSRQQLAAVASVEKTSTGIRIKFYDKLKALELLGKAMGLFDGIAQEDEPNNLLEALVASTNGEVRTDDLPELQQAAAAGHDLVEPSRLEGP